MTNLVAFWILCPLSARPSRDGSHGLVLETAKKNRRMIPTETEVHHWLAKRTNGQSSKIESSKRLTVYFTQRKTWCFLGWGTLKDIHIPFPNANLHKNHFDNYLANWSVRILDFKISGCWKSVSVVTHNNCYKDNRKVNKVKSDQNLVSPRKINIFFSRQVMRIKKNINKLNTDLGGGGEDWVVVHSLFERAKNNKKKMKIKANTLDKYLIVISILRLCYFWCNSFQLSSSCQIATSWGHMPPWFCNPKIPPISLPLKNP